jgi:regulatory protein
MEYIEKKKAKAKAERICMRQEKCIFDIKQKFFEWKVNPDHYSDIIQSLLDDKYIDEKRYVEFFIKDKFNINKWGKTKIRFTLLQKQIDENLINNHLNEIDNFEYKTLIKNELTKKINTLNSLDFNTLKNKLLQFGSSRGYELEYLYPLIEEFKN